LGDERRIPLSSSSSSSHAASDAVGPARGAETRVRSELVAPGGRLAASSQDAEIRLARRLGIAGSREGLGLLPADVRMLGAALDDWVRVRDSWASFRHSCAGFKPGHGGAWYFTPPGAGAERVRVAVHAFGVPRTGEPFRGVERPHELLRPVAVAPGVFVVRELRRTGEVLTPPAGLRTGLVYAIGLALELTAWREEARLARNQRAAASAGIDEEVWLERGEESFVSGLVTWV
jgi:hypothetical protein